MKRIYHPYWLWEDYKAGFYDNCSGENKEQHKKNIKKMFNDKNLTYEYMLKVIELWKYSCEHNLTNNSVNKIAYIGQAACCIYCGAPSTVTMETWSELSQEVRDRSDKIADEIITMWNKNNKRIQLCLNLD